MFYFLLGLNAGLILYPLSRWAFRWWFHRRPFLAAMRLAQRVNAERGPDTP